MPEERPFDRNLYRVRATTRRIRSGPFIRFSDPELVALTAGGDGAAYDELVMRYHNSARHKALSIIHDYQVAEDIAQDAFLKAYRALAELQDPRKFHAWILTIVQHTALDFVRARRENLSLESMKDQGFEAPRESRGIQIEKLENREDDFRVLEALRDLREDYREIIVLKHVEKLSYKEIAERLGMSVSAVGEKLSRVRKMLNRRLEKIRVRKDEDAQPDESA
jgi:RNA polymerase sigma-70 factor (ECF subfamily)